MSFQESTNLQTNWQSRLNCLTMNQQPPTMNFLLDLFFPKKCVGCGKSGSFFCPNCINNITQTDLVCPFCERLSLGGVIHPACTRKFGLNGLWSLGTYQPPLKLAIQKLKYKWVRGLAVNLVDILIEYWAKYQPLLLDQIKKSHGQNWLITAVPLHKSRENWRGFNQSELIAKLFAQKLGLKYQNLLKRTKKTRPQVGLESYQRKQNIKNAFSLTKRYTLDANILLIDDVWTTGSTLKECCYVLKRGGAKQVWALTLAR